MHHARLCALAFLAVLGPNCDGSSSSAKVLFKDDFSVPWGVIAGASTVAIDGAAGTPAPSMSITYVDLTGVGGPTFDSTKGFTLTVDLQEDTGVGTQGAMYLTHTGNNNIYTGVNIGDGYASYQTDPTGANWQGANPTFATDANFHEYVIKFDKDGTITWTRDGVLHQTVTGFPAFTYKVTFIIGGGVIRADSMRVTQP